jgi:membrane-associated HD superfamily phosphohydrolase
VSVPYVKQKKHHLFTKGVNHVTKEKKQIVTVEEAVEPAVIKTSAACSKCFQEKTSRGIPHPCTETSKKENLVNLVLNQKEAGQEQIVSKVLKQVIENKDGEQGKEIKLNQLKGGNKLSVKIGQNKGEDAGIVDALTVAKLKKRLDLSDREMGTCLKILKEGKVKVEKNVMEVLKEIGRSLEEEYDDVKMNFEKSIADDDDEATKKATKKTKKIVVK